MSKVTTLSVPAAEVAQGGMVTRSVEGREIVICRIKDGVFALDNICTHAFARLSEGRLRGNRLICPLHGASFDVRDGRALGAPASKPLATYAVALIEEQIVVSVDATPSA